MLHFRATENTRNQNPKKQRSSFLKAGRLAHEKLLMEEQRVIDQAAQAGPGLGVL